MLFKLYLQDKELTGIGFDWIEVLAIVPFRATVHQACDTCGAETEDQSSFYILQSWFYCRTETGILQLPEDDVMHEVAYGIYCEQGGEVEAKAKRDGIMAFLESQENDSEGDYDA
jgi:hypothetical protein